MERRTVGAAEIMKKLGDVWFTNGYGDRFPARDADVMLAAENGLITCGFQHYHEEEREFEVERLHVSIWNVTDQARVIFYEYGDGQWKKLFQESLLNRYPQFVQKESGDEIKIILKCSNGVVWIKYSKASVVHEDNWRKCEKCKRAFHIWPQDLMSKGVSAIRGNGKPLCSCCGHPSEY